MNGSWVKDEKQIALRQLVIGKEIDGDRWQRTIYFDLKNSLCYVPIVSEKDYQKAKEQGIYLIDGEEGHHFADVEWMLKHSEFAHDENGSREESNKFRAWIYNLLKEQKDKE